MADEDTPLIANSSQSPEPEKTGVAPNSQEAAATHVTLLPVVRQDEKNAGLQGSNVTSMFLALLSQNDQKLLELAQIVGNSVDRQSDHAQETISKLQKELGDERVAHARTDERLKTVLRKDRISAFLTALGGTVLGYGLSDLGKV